MAKAKPKTKPRYGYLVAMLVIALVIGGVVGIYFAGIGFKNQLVANYQTTEPIKTSFNVDPTDQSKYCYDSDAGIDPYIAGYVKSIGSNPTTSVSGQDTCADSTTLTEYYCEGIVGKTTTIPCENQCVNSACV